MITQDGQVEVNGLLLGPGTNYLIREFKPYSRSVRNKQQDMAWGAGAWSGREDIDAAAIPLRVEIEVDGGQAAWMAARRVLGAALTASSTDVTLRWQLGGITELMYVRPRLVDPDLDFVGVGWGPVSCALMALDPRVYTDTVSTAQLVLPTSSGGLTFPMTAPFTIAATTIAGRTTISTTGTLDASLTFRFAANGSQLVQPRVTVVSGGVPTVLLADMTLEAGQWLTVDTGTRTALLNDVVSRRGVMKGDFPKLPKLSTADLAFDAGLYSADATLTATWRDTYA